MKVEVKVRPTGAINGDLWPDVGGVIDLPEHVAAGMIDAGFVAAVKVAPKVEHRPAPEGKAETTSRNTGRKSKR